VRCFVLLLPGPPSERCLFPDHTPASSLRQSDRRLTAEPVEAVFRCLVPDVI
jgi:hypothetical protein